MLPKIFRAPVDTAEGGTDGVVIVAEGEVLQLPEGFDPASATYVRAGPDMMLTGADGVKVVVADFFMAETPPALMGTDGSRITGGLAARLAGPAAPGQVAGEVMPSEAIGRVSTLTGEVTVIRADGTRVTLQAGDSMFMGDILETGVGAGVGIILADETSLSMADEGRMVLDEMVYDPGIQEGSISLSVLQGVFTIVSGAVAKTDPEAMMVHTPVATIGIRGTQLGIDLTGEEGLTVVMMEEADGFVGEIFVSNDAGVMTINQANFALTVASFNAPPTAAPMFSSEMLLNTFGGSLTFLPTEAGNANVYGQEPAVGGGEEGEEELGAEEGVEEAEFETAAGEEAAPEVTPPDVTYGEEIEPMGVVEGFPPPPEIIEPILTPTSTTDTGQEDRVSAPPSPEPPVNEPPVAEPGRVLTAEDNVFTGQLLATDLEGGELIFGVAEGGDPTNGTITVNPDGSFEYTPDQDFGGADTFTYLVTDDAGATATATVTVTVTPVADVPQVAAADVTGFEDAAVTLSIAANMPADTTEQVASVTINGVPAGAVLSAGTDNGDGTWTVSPNQLRSLTLTPPTDYSGTFDLGVTVTSTDGGVASNSLAVTFAPVADVPQLAVADVSGMEDSSIMLTISSAMAPETGETVETLTITGVPQGAQLSAGTDNGDGTWTLVPGDLGGLTLTPPTDYSGAFNIGVSVTSSDGGVATDSFNVDIGAVTDIPVVAVNDVTGNEDASISLTLAASMPAGTTEAVDTITIGGVPEGAVLSAGTDNEDGTWTLNPDQLTDLTITPPTDYNGTFNLGVTVISTDGGTSSNTMGVTVNPLADVPQIALADASGAEDTTVSLTLAASMPADTTETVDSVTISGVPAGATLSTGTDNGDGTWTLSADQLSGLTLTPPTDYNGSFNLTISAVSTDGGVATGGISVNVSPVADAPVIAVSDASGYEDAAISLNLAASMQADTTETVDSVIISGVPEGATLSAGTDNGDGTWALNVGDLDGLTITPPADYNGAFNLGVNAISTDGGVATSSLAVHVGAVTDVPIVAVTDVAGSEDTSIALTIAANMPADTTETLDSVTITGVPTGAILSAGTDNGDGSWSVSANELSGLNLTPPTNYSGAIALSVTAVSSDGGTATSDFNVGVAPVADVPVLQVSDVVVTIETPPGGGEIIFGTKGDDELVGTPGADIIVGGSGEDIIYGDSGEGGGGEVPPLGEPVIVELNVDAALNDMDGSEALSIEVAGVPDGANLSLGTDNGEGTWLLQGDDLNNLDSLTMTFPEGTTAEDFALNVTATATETETGETATATGIIDITFEGGGEGAGDLIFGGKGEDEIYGGGGADVIFGGKGEDELYGGAGDDVLVGGKGEDVLVGGAGDDTLIGGEAADEFVFRAGDGNDIILDLGEQDELRFEGPEFSAEDFTISTNGDDTSTITFGEVAGVSVTLKDVELEPGEGYSVTQDGDTVVVTFEEDFGN